MVYCDDPKCPGWFVNMEKLTIERCDTCKQFDSDEQAARHVHGLYEEERKKKEKEPKLVIYPDGDGDTNNPRGWDNLGTMVCWHPRYSLGDNPEQPKANPGDYWTGEDEPHIKLPLYLYDHGGITMSTEPFSCSWDSGQVGWIWVTIADVKKEFGVKSINGAIKKKVINILEQEVKTYDQYLRGSCWGFEYGEDSCWGFLGDTLEETGLIEALEKHSIPREVINKAWEDRHA